MTETPSELPPPSEPAPEPPPELAPPPQPLNASSQRRALAIERRPVRLSRSMLWATFFVGLVVVSPFAASLWITPPGWAGERTVVIAPVNTADPVDVAAIESGPR